MNDLGPHGELFKYDHIQNLLTAKYARPNIQNSDPIRASSSRLELLSLQITSPITPCFIVQQNNLNEHLIGVDEHPCALLV